MTHDELDQLQSSSNALVGGWVGSMTSVGSQMCYGLIVCMHVIPRRLAHLLRSTTPTSILAESWPEQPTDGRLEYVPSVG